MMLAGLALPLMLALPALQAGVAIRVRVTDAATGAPVVMAMATLSDAARSARSDSAGRVSFTRVGAGPHHLAIRRIGYVPRLLHVLVGHTGSLDLTVVLSPLPTALRRVRVERPGHRALRDAADASAPPARPGERVMSGAAIRDHPLLAEPDALLAMVGGHVAAAPESPAGLHVLGGAADQLAYFVDGVPNLSPYHAGSTFGALDPDVLERITLQLQPGITARSDALGGVVLATTRAVPSRRRASGALSPSQVRSTVDVPLGRDGAAGLLVNARVTAPGYLRAPGEPSHLRGSGRDGLARLALPAWGGELRVLAFGSANDQMVASRIPEREAPALAGRPRSELEWSSHSVGATWTRTSPSAPDSTRPSSIRISLWRADARSQADWRIDSASLAYALADVGAHVVRERADARGVTTASIRAQRRASRQRSSPLGIAVGTPATAVAPLATFRAERRQRITPGLDVAVGATAWAADDGWSGAPSLEATWRPSGSLLLAVAADARRQFVQSVRNPESVTGTIFPAELSVVAGDVMPVASSRERSVQIEWRPAPSRFVALRGWHRSMRGLAVTAMTTEGPWAGGAVASGRGAVRGVSLDASLRHARFGVVGSYSLQDVQLTALDSSYRPQHAATHAADMGVVLYPEPALALRLGVHAAVGRRVTPVEGSLEWESCNLMDWGCEFAAGSLRRGGGLGTRALPAYLRLDGGVRKHWHMQFGGSDVEVGSYLTVSNLLGRRNVLTIVRDPVTGTERRITMRPRGPLVVGLEWRF